MHNSILQISDINNNCVGTGFVFDKDNGGVYVATCGHVLNACDGGILVDGNDCEVLVNKYDEGLDLATLYVPELSVEPLDIADEVTEANKVWVVGYSSFQGHPKREAIRDIITKLDVMVKTPNPIDIIKLTPSEPISNGYSGSPVICHDSNHVVGIVSLQTGTGSNYAINIKHLHEISSRKIPLPIVSNVKVSQKIELVTQLEIADYVVIGKAFDEELNSALRSFTGQPNVWITPELHTMAEDSSGSVDDNLINMEDVIAKPRSLMIRARQQFGLTSLARYLVKEAWAGADKPSYWLYLDANDLKPHTKEIDKLVLRKVKEVSLSVEDIECVILDEFTHRIKDANEIVNKLSSYFCNVPIIVMETILDSVFVNDSLESTSTRSFNVLHLWALPRSEVRRVVSKYNDESYIGDENQVVEKIILDLEVLNIPRTPLNCLTILKISEAGFDDSPVNRTEMIKRVLFLLFNISEIPNYKSKPDLKDTEYVLGHLCEIMIKESKYYFTREHFLATISEFCELKEIDLDTHVIFDILYSNSIIIKREKGFCFKFSYWVFYFAAHWMYHNKKFSDYILNDMNYASYPELIEFYTGIDRSRKDALEILTNDLKSECDVVEKKCGIPSGFNIYSELLWKPSEQSVQQMHDDLNETMQQSNLPVPVKDKFADNSYNRSRPLNQDVYQILEEWSLLRLMRGVQASAKALRNSDFVDPEIRHKLLEQILRSWEQITRVILILTPMLSERGVATMDGATFVLTKDFDSCSSFEEKVGAIIKQIPSNVVGWYKDDLFSKKMGPLLYNHAKDQTDELTIHNLNLLILHKRPKGWEEQIANYIASANKNSFYLYDLYDTLRVQYRYAFVPKDTLKSLGDLLTMAVTKHDLGIKKPSRKVIEKYSAKVLAAKCEK